VLGTTRRRHLDLEDSRWQLWRLTDDESTALVRHALAIRENSELIWRLSCGSGPTLLQAFLALKEAFGPSSKRRDRYKCSFSFPLLLTLGPDPLPAYLLHVLDLKGTIRVPMARLCAQRPDPAQRNRTHDPDPAELSQGQMDWLVSFLYDHLSRRGAVLEQQPATPFFRGIESVLFIYGHDGRAGFARNFESLGDGGASAHDAYRAACRELEARRPRRDARRLIARITSEA